MKLNLYKRIIFFILLFLPNLITAQTSGFEWLKSLSGSNDDVVRGVCIDSVGNIYATGTFTDGANSITSTGGVDSNISKISQGIPYAKNQYDFSPIIKLITDSLSKIGNNCGLIIMRNDSILYKQYWGSWSDDTYQPIASGSKMASMALIMKLIDEGYLSPNDTVQKYLPSFSGKPYITLHQLMNHTSGLPGNTSYISDNSITLQEAVDNIGLKTQMTSYAPGTAFQYGGVSMHVAGRMAEIATNTRWDTLFKNKIATPLGMTNTDYLGLGNTTNFRIAGGIGTTMPDFAKFLNMMLHNGKYNNLQLIDSLTIKMMTTDQTNGVPLIATPYEGDLLRENLRYGYGNWIEEVSNGKTTQFGSQGAFGFTPWVDRCRNISCVFFVKKSLAAIQPTHTKLRNLVEQIIPLATPKPVITILGKQLKSSYPAGIQWYLNGLLLQDSIKETITPTQSGNYSVKYIIAGGCEIVSDAVSFSPTKTIDTKSSEKFSIFTDSETKAINITTNYENLFTVEMFDLMGRALLTKQCIGNSKIDVSNFINHAYLVRLKYTNTLFTKIILMK